MHQNKKIDINLNLVMFLIVVLGALIITVPIVGRVPPHSDEHQFLMNAFRIMNGQELDNYLHIAATEYSLAGFFLVVNLFTRSGVNFPQGSPSPVTYYYAHMFGAILYFLTFILGAIVIQKREKEIKLRTIIFSILYFGSVALAERFLRVNSDSFSIFIFLNFVVLSFWQHLHKPSIAEMFLLNALFIFLGSFTNIKSLSLMFPLVALNTLMPFVWYKKSADTKTDEKFELSKIYRFILYAIGIVAVCLALWAIAIPKPFSNIKYWYTVKNTILYGTSFDFDYPGQSYKSWLVYIYDLIVYQMGVIPLALFLALFLVTFYIKRKQFLSYFWQEFKKDFDFNLLKNGEVYKITEVVLSAGFITYYLAVSSRMVHWSRWGAPLGMMAILILSSVIEKLIYYVFPRFDEKKLYVIPFLPILLIFIWGSRIALSLDLYNTAYSVKEDYPLTKADTIKFMQEKGIVTPEDVKNRIAWFTGYTPNIRSISFEQVIEPANQKVEYLLWPEWNSGLLLTNKNVDRSSHNQRAFIDNYSDGIEYRFPVSTAKYIYDLRLFAWKVLGISYIPEVDSMVEPYYAAVKLKRPFDSINSHYIVPFKDLAHYSTEYSRLFNLVNLKDSYMFPPCYTYQSVVNVSDGSFVYSPLDIGPFGKTAGLYCHSLRFRVFPKGIYWIKINGLPNDPGNEQKLYYSLGTFRWDPQTKTAMLVTSNTIITSEIGVATKEQILPDLNFEVWYTYNQEIIQAIDKADKEAAEAAKLQAQQEPQQPSP